MKKLLIVMAMLSMTIGTMAENLTVANVVLPQNGTVEIEIGLTNPTSVYESFSLELNLPNGVVPVMASNNYPDFTLGTRFTGLTTGYKDGNIATFAHLTDGNAITGTSGMLFAAIVKVDGDLDVGTVLNATISEIKFTTTGLVNETLDNVQFTITIDNPVDTRTLLDENSTTIPEAATGVDVRVKRTINATTWSTICLPFAMTEAQVKAAFGEDVMLGDFTGYDITEDNDDKIVGITVNFSDATSIEANHPYIIYVSDAVTSFTVDGVTIDPEDEPCVSFGTTTGRGNNAVYHPADFVGTYVSDFDFFQAAYSGHPLFFSGNKFYYATANTKHMKAYRAYFDFDDYLPEVEPTEGARVILSFDDGNTKIDARTMEPIETGKVYNMAGQYVGEAENTGRLKKGVYIVNGKKKVIK